MPAIVRDIEVEIGARWYSPLLLKNGDGSIYDLTGATARMMIRDNDGALLVELSTGNGRLRIDVQSGRIDREIGALTTGAIEAEKGVYDMEILPAGDADLAWKLYRGKVKFVAEVTHD